MDADVAACLDHAWVFSRDALADVEVLQGEGRTDVRYVLPDLDLRALQVDDNLGDLRGALLDDDCKGSAVRARAAARLEGCILILLRFAKSEAVEFQRSGAGMLLDEPGSPLNFFNR